jgi:hypothetical protein
VRSISLLCCWDTCLLKKPSLVSFCGALHFRHIFRSNKVSQLSP